MSTLYNATSELGRKRVIFMRSVRPNHLAGGHGAIAARFLIVVALFAASGSAAAADTTDTSSPAEKAAVGSVQGRTWDSIKKLPDWSGVWVLTDESWTDAVLAEHGRDGGRVPLSARYLKIRAAHMASPDYTQFSNESKCIPVGIPESTGIPLGHEYLFTPARVTVIFENGIVRRIDTSGRPHPPQNELTPTFAGNSIGHWEGRTLVVDTIGIVSQAEFLIGLHTTEKTHLTEKIFRKNRDTLQIDTVITDPEIFTRPYAYTRLYKYSTIAPLDYYPCVEGNRDTMVNGIQTGVDLTPPPASKP
jgi:hypothetical protein